MRPHFEEHPSHCSNQGLLGPSTDMLRKGIQPYSSIVGSVHKLYYYHGFPGQHLQDATHEFEIHPKDVELLLQLPQNLED